VKQQVQTIPRMDTRPIYTDENAQAKVLTLKPGESLRRNITHVDVFFMS
jgi:hypothetical protein